MNEELVKQVIVIRRDLGMRRGKEIAQGAHGAMAFLTRRLHWISPDPFRPEDTPSAHSMAFLMLTPVQRLWLESSFRKVTLQADTEDELLALYAAAEAAGLEAHLVTDAGLTEFAGKPTNTALVIGPDYDEKIDKVTAELRLY